MDHSNPPAARSLHPPVLIYDGGCGFCKFWVKRWKHTTGSAVEYIPYQYIKGQLAPLSHKDFETAVHFLDKDGTITKGADAIFRCLNHAPRLQWLVKIYGSFAIFRFLAAAIYQFISTHRGAASKVTSLIYGSDEVSNDDIYNPMIDHQQSSPAPPEEFQAVAQKIIEICVRLHTRNMLASADGNISYRLSDQQILITPAGKHKGYINISDLAVITIDNEIICGSPSSERLMHLEVYRQCKQARCVVHAHPPTAIAWSVAQPELKELPSECLSEVILAVGRIPIARYARPSTMAMGECLREYLPKHRVMILARHGALSWGESLDEAYNGMERLEHSAHILKLAHDLGGLTNLPNDEVLFLRELRAQLGDRTL